jgi:photosystem II stability/assembly factor-like uncharacterized protein
MKRSNYFLIVVFLLFVCSSLFAQWTVQNSGIPTGDQVVLAAVNENICWGVTRSFGVRYVTRTTDGGATWVASNLNSLNDFYSIAALSADTAWIAATGSIYNTTNGGVNWTQQLATGLMLIVRFFDSNNGVCIGSLGIGNSEIYTTTNGGSLWTPVPPSSIPDPVNGEGFIPDNAWVVGNTIWVNTNGNFNFPGSLYKSTDRGITWNVTRPINDQSGSFCGFKDSLNGLLSSSFNNLVKRTTDGGATWTNTASVPAGVTPFLIAYVPGSSSAYMITSFTFSTQIPGSAYTLDNGATWTTVDNVTHGRAAFVSPSVGWSWGGANVIYKWTGPVLPVELTSFTAQVQDQKVILNWTTATELNNRGFEIQRKVVEGEFATVGFVKGEGTTTNQKEYSYADKNLAEGKYFYRLKQLDLNGEYEFSKTIEVEVRSLDNFTLEQNYPNPFNPTTTIGYVLQEKSNTKLTLINTIGQEVAILVNEEQDKGYHKFALNAANLPSGVYLYKLQSGSFIETKKLMLLK